MFVRVPCHSRYLFKLYIVYFPSFQDEGDTSKIKADKEKEKEKHIYFTNGYHNPALDKSDVGDRSFVYSVDSTLQYETHL